MLGWKACLNKSVKIEITLSGFANRSKIKPEVNNRKN